MVEKLSVEVALEGSEQVQRDLTKLEQSFSDAGLAIRRFAESFAAISAAAGAVAITAAVGAMIKFTGAVEETSKALTELQKVSGASFQNLSAMQQVFSAGGTALNKFATEFGNLSEKIAAATQVKRIRDADRAWVEWANDIDTVRGQFEKLAVGGGVTFSSLTRLDTKVQALLESLGKAGSAQDQWLKLADIFKNLGSDMERAQLGKALGLSPESIATLAQGSAALRQMQAEAERLGLTLTTSNQQALQQMAQGWNQFTALLSAAFQKIAAAAAPAFANILSIAQTALQNIVDDFNNMPIGQAAANIVNRLAPAFSAIGEVLGPLMTQIGNTLGVALVAGIGAGVDAAFAALWERIKREVLDNLIAIGQGIARFTGTTGPAISGGEAGAVPGMAGGGLLGGRGTGTSDSNLAWVSRGEHIMPAAAVAQPGVLSFLEALRRSGGNLGRVLDGMGRFAMGGLVPRPAMAFAGGGPVGSMSNVTIQFPGLPDIGGLRASTATVDELRRAAALAQVRSGGRKPSRYS